MPHHRRCVAVLLAGALAAAGCGSNPLESPPPTIEPATAAVSPPTTIPASGEVLPFPGRPNAALFDAATATLAVFTPAGEENTGPSQLTLLGSPAARSVPLPGAASAISGDGRGEVYAATRGGFFTVDLTTATAERTSIDGQADTEFTAVARRSDGQMVLGSADGTAFVLGPDLAVTGKERIFSRVDAIVTVGDTAVVLDRGQTSVTALDPQGSRRQSLRAGLGATSIVADPLGRVLVTDTRGGQLLVFGADPLIARQAYPVAGAPFGLTGSRGLVWVSLSASNTVVGYDLSTGIPVEKVRYPTVQQPNSLAFDDASGTLYVISGSGGGIQVIRDAAGAR